MGGLGTILGGAALGLGSASMSQKPVRYESSSSVHEVMTPSLPVTPELPGTADGTGDGQAGNAEMEEARERERQEAALRRQQAGDVYTSGLGAAGLAGTAKKSLLGG